MTSARRESGPPRHPLARFRGWTLILVATGLYLIAVVGTLYTIETAYYVPAKWDIIREEMLDRRYINYDFATPAYNTAREYANMAYSTPDNPRLEELREVAKEKARELLLSSDVITAVALETSEGDEVFLVEDRDRLATQSTFRNSLFSRRFERAASSSIGAGPNNELYAVFRIFVTHAREDQGISAYDEIAVLTDKYRWIMIGSFAFYTLIYGLVLHQVLIPLSRVLSHLQSPLRGGGRPIASPQSEVERAYNTVARDANLTVLSKALREKISDEGISYISPVLEAIPTIVEDTISLSGVQVWRCSRINPSLPWQLDRVYTAGSENGSGRADSPLLEMIGTEDPAADRDAWSARVVALAPRRHYFVDVLDLREDQLVLLVIPHARHGTGFGTWWTDFFARIAQELRYAIMSVEEQRRMILAEKSKANISLSRNLGHDLTNIIATSKLELMNVKAFLSLKPEEVANSPRKQQLFHESLESLLNNTRFLQEIVNLYRSFSYLQKPKFEDVQLSELVQDVVQLYRLSISKAIEVRTELAESLPLCRIEPRLLRLALFNLLTNAAEAIKRASDRENPEGLIIVNTCFHRDTGKLEVTVEDNGSGIRDPEGNLLAQDALQEIFRLGFSTKRDQEGEGLGLNWVQSIVREFHGGEILARNRPEGGAAFTIRIPLQHSSDSRISKVEEVP